MKDTRRTLAVKMPQETYKNLLGKSKELGATMPAVVRLLIATWLESELSSSKLSDAKIEKPLNG